MGLRMESISERILHERFPETLGMTPHNCGLQCVNNNKILLPPVMTAQIECIMTKKVLEPLSKEVLVGLHTLIEKDSRKHWLTIYITIFILLHSCASLTAADQRRALKHGSQVGGSDGGSKEFANYVF